MKYTSDVFQRLSRGQFISSNSIDSLTRAIYNDIEENQKEYEDYFARIDFILESGDGYYYFSRREAKVITENKLKSFIPWIDILDFLMTFDSTFAAGSQFTIAQIEMSVSSDIEQKEKLENLYPDKKSLHNKIETLATQLTSQGFAELVNENTGMYQMTMAFKYLTGIIECLNIDEEVKDEIPE